MNISIERPQRMRYGADSPQGKPPELSDFAKRIIDMIVQLPTFVWLEEKFRQSLQIGDGKVRIGEPQKLSNPATAEKLPPWELRALASGVPPQPPKRTPVPATYSTPPNAKESLSNAAVQRYQARAAEARAASPSFLSGKRLAVAAEQRMQYARHQLSIAGPCREAIELARREGIDFEQALAMLGVASLPLPL